jgi:predicted transcriptional regulator
MSDPSQLSRRERQVMDVVYGLGKATASDVLAGMPDPPTRAAVRTFLRILEVKGHLVHHKEGREFVYSPTKTPRKVGQSALRRVLQTFFGGSLENAIAAHLSDPRAGLSPEQVGRFQRLIDQAREKGD